jgi:hypothetical protein
MRARWRQWFRLSRKRRHEMHQMPQTAIRADRDREDSRRPEVLRPEVRAAVIPARATQAGQAVGGHDDRPATNGPSAVTAQHAQHANCARNCAALRSGSESDNRCTLCGQEGHRASHCPLANQGHASRAQAHLQPDWPFGEGYVSQLAPHYGKQDGRGQHNVGKADTSKYAPKHPKAGAPLPGNRAPKGSK